MKAFFLIQLILALASAQLAPFTTYTGQVLNYNQFYKFSGKQGILVEEVISNLSNYTLSLWFRLSTLPSVQGIPMQILSMDGDGLQISMSARDEFYLSGHSNFQKILTGDIRPGQWYILVISAAQNSSNIQIKAVSGQILISASMNTFFPQDQTQISFTKTFLGISQDSTNGFLGNIRNFKLLQQVLTDTIIWRIQFIRLYPTYGLRMQVLMNFLEDINNEASYGLGKIFGTQIPGLTIENDFQGTVWCWNPQILFPQFLDFAGSSPKVSFGNYVIVDNYDFINTVTGTVKLWFCRKSIDTPTDEQLFLHNTMLNLSISGSNYNNVTFTGRNQYSQSVSQFTRFKLWYYIQAATSNTSFSLYFQDQSNQFTFSTGQVPYQIQPLSGTGFYYQIGQGFQGFIRGIKYYKSYISTVNSGMVVTLDSDQMLIYYYYFTLDTYSKSSNSFTNLAQQNFKTGINVQSGPATFTSMVYYDSLSKIPTEGTLNTPLYFDGYTCQDDRTKYQTSSSSSYISTSLQIDPHNGDFTIEFWTRQTKGQSGMAVFISVADKVQPQYLYTSIRVENGVLVCYPQFQNKEKLIYGGYSATPMNWIHIACAFNFNDKKIDGTFWDGANSYTYSVFSNSTATINQILGKQVLFWVNGVPSSSQYGFNKAFYQEIKFWNFAKKPTDITLQKFNQLDVFQEQSSLYSYLKLQNDGYKNQAGLDYADPSLQKTYSSSNMAWVSNQELLVCPLGYFHYDSSQTTCYRDGIIGGAELSVFKTANSYIVKASELVYESDYIYAYRFQIYNFTWQLQVQTKSNIADQVQFPKYFSPQAQNEYLEFTFDQVANNPGIYKFQYQIQDKKYYQATFQSSITIKTLNCLQMIVDNQQEDATINVQFKEYQFKKTDAFISLQTSGCQNYIFDSSLLIMKYLNISGLSQAFYNPSKQAIQITVADQSKMPTQAQSLIMQYAFKNPYTKDLILYNKSINFEWVRYINVIVQSDFPSMWYGDNMHLSSLASQSFNMIGAFSLSYEWVCPDPLMYICSRTQGQEISVTFGQFQISGMNYGEKYSFTQIIHVTDSVTQVVQSFQGSIEMLWVSETYDSYLKGNSVLLKLNRSLGSCKHKYQCLYLLKHQKNILRHV